MVTHREGMFPRSLSPTPASTPTQQELLLISSSHLCAFIIHDPVQRSGSLSQENRSIDVSNPFGSSCFLTAQPEWSQI
ncbi:hypothetical protein GN956_G17074 [Arapaima gigas]